MKNILIIMRLTVLIDAEVVPWNFLNIPSTLQDHSFDLLGVVVTHI